MGVGEANINNIMGGIESTGGVRLHNHRRKLKQRFDIIKKLGQGTYGKVQLGINKETGQEVAIKTIKKCKIETEADLIRIRREIQIMSSVQHPNIIHIYEVFENREKMVLVMEYAAGGELYDYLSERKVLIEDEARRIFRQISTAVYYCHKHKICHRDLKLENILLDENGNAKIADFGLSNVFDDQRLLSTFCGSPLYASPEIVKGTPYHGPEVDCWSLGVLLYTLVYGAMPFDGSNFKRLVKQISQGDYFEPKKPSPASPLIRDMLTVNPKKRADVEKICNHWWVNQDYEESCLDIAEDLANQTPVRLDLLLSLAPPPPPAGSDQLLVAGEQIAEEAPGGSGEASQSVPARSQSVGSLMELSHPAERRIRALVADDSTSNSSSTKSTPKRKLETTVSTENANQVNGGDAKRMEISSSTTTVLEEASAPEPTEQTVNRSATQTLTPTQQMEVIETPTTEVDPSLQGAACAEILEEAAAKKKEPKKATSGVKVKKTLSPKKKAAETVEAAPIAAEVPKPEAAALAAADKENNATAAPQEVAGEASAVEKPSEVTPTAAAPVTAKKEDASKPAVKRKVVKKKVLADKHENTPPPTAKATEAEPAPEAKAVSCEATVPEEVATKPKESAVQQQQTVATVPSPEAPQQRTEQSASEAPQKPIERRRSKIFETAEKFQSLMTSDSAHKAPVEKPKKIIIPGVSVGGFKKEFERKASLTSAVAPSALLARKTVSLDKPEVKQDVAAVTQPTTATTLGKDKSPPKEGGAAVVQEKSAPAVETVAPEEEVRKKQLKNAVSVISQAIEKEGARKSKSRPSVFRKPPVPFGAGGRSASGSIAMISSPLSPPPIASADVKRRLTLPLGGNLEDTRQATVQVSTPEHTRFMAPPLQRQVAEEEEEDEPKSSSLEITLKSATLPRRKTHAEIQLDYPQPKPAQMEFKTEVAHQIEQPHPPKVLTQRSEVTFPIQSPNQRLHSFRSASLEPETKCHPRPTPPRERIIPISFESEKPPQESPPTKPPVARGFSSQRSLQSGSNLSRQSTLESESEVTSAAEPIKKSPREYIIPIAIEGGGYVTPRAGSLEPSESAASANTASSTGRRATGGFGSRTRRINSLLTDRDASEDESPFSMLHRHSSFGRDSDNEDPRRDAFHMHRLRSSRPKATLEHTDSLSSGEDDDEGFEILTAENLFSTLLSRVRSLTQRLNVDDDRPAGFPSSRLFSHFEPSGNFWNLHNRDPLTRHSPLGRTFSRERSTGGSANSSRSNLGAPWRRSVSRDLASDIENVFKDSPTATLPRDKNTKKCHQQSTQQQQQNNIDLNLSDLDLKKLKLSEEDAVALSYLTPGLSRRIQKQLLAQLPTSQARKLSRTLSLRNGDRSTPETPVETSQDHRKSTIKEGEVYSSADTDLCQSYSGLDRTYDRYSPYNDRSCKSEGFDYNSAAKHRPHRSTSLLETGRGPAGYTRTASGRPMAFSRSPDSSLSESLDLNSSRNSEYSSNLYSPESSCLGKYLTTGRYHKSQSVPEDCNSTLRRPGSAQRRISRFLRPDFFDTPREESMYEKEKKEREMETQKVLKEIRDKRIKNRLSSRRDRSTSRDDSLAARSFSTSLDGADTGTTTIGNFVKDLLASERSKHQEDTESCASVPDTSAENTEEVCTKEILNNVSENIKKLEIAQVQAENEPQVEPPLVVQPLKKDTKLTRPKSYPSENESKILSVAPAEKTKIAKLKKGLAVGKKSKESSPKMSEEHPEKPTSTKNKFLHSIEKKFEKLKAFNSSGNHEEQKTATNVGNAIRKLREQSLPKTTEHMITESGLIKRAVSVEDLSVMGSITEAGKTLQASRKSVTKILGLFKKYEEKENGKKECAKAKKATKEVELEATATKNGDVAKSRKAEDSNGQVPEAVTNGSTKLQRPKSLLMDRVKKLNKTEPLVPSSDSPAATKSKLPVNTTSRRSMNLDTPTSPTEAQSTATNSIAQNGTTDTPPCNEAADRKNLRLDFSKIPSAQSLKSPNGESDLSPGGDPDNESVIDRIRRKSFYSRFNEAPKKARSTAAVRDYKDFELKYGQVDLVSPTSSDGHHHRSSSRSSATREHKAYGRSSSLLEGNAKYQTFNPRLMKRMRDGSRDGGASFTDEPKCLQNESSSKCRSSSVSPNPPFSATTRLQNNNNNINISSNSSSSNNNSPVTVNGSAIA